MTFHYGSICSGIEAASVAFEPLGWQPRFFAEVDKFASQVLAQRFGCNLPGAPLPANGIPNYGDFTKIDGSIGSVDLLVGGTPCQSFSVAGKRLGLDDPRGNLALEFLALARRLGSRWILWENVAGVLSSQSDDGSNDFATFLAFANECGFGCAWRVLDAQYVRVDGFAHAVPQRRRRLILVGYLGDWRRAAAVLFEPESMRGDPAPARRARQADLAAAAAGARERRRLERLISDDDIAGTVSAKWAKGSGGPAGDEVQNLIAVALGELEAVRRLTPLECERLQGFPDGWTDIVLANGRRALPRPRYRAIGNSMAVNVMRWTGRRIALAEQVFNDIEGVK
jgi:DNA (cytosine-5)-methyltransferase 1